MCHFVRLSSGQRPRQTKTLLSARIFQELRDHFPVAKGKEQVDSSLQTKAPLLLVSLWTFHPTSPLEVMVLTCL